MTDISFEKKYDACFISKDELTGVKGYSSRLGLVKGNIYLLAGNIVLSFVTNKNYEFQSFLLGKVVEQDVNEFCSTLENSSENVNVSILNQDKQEERDDKDDNKNSYLFYFILIAIAFLIIFLFAKIIL